jgi:hypothetical protein
VRWRDIQLLKEDFGPCRSELHPADLLAIEDYDPGVVSTPQVGELSLLICLDPLYPGTGKRFDRFHIEIKSKGVVVRVRRSEGNCHWRGENIGRWRSDRLSLPRSP